MPTIRHAEHKTSVRIDLATTIPEPRAVVHQLIVRILANSQAVPQPPAHESFLFDMRAIQAAHIHLHNTWAARKPPRWLAREQPTDGLTGRDLQTAEMRNAVIRAIADANWLYDNDPDRRLE